MLQINIDRGKAAHDLLLATASSMSADLVMLSEPNRKLAKAAGWECDARGDAALVILNKTLTVSEIYRGKGFIGFKLKDFAAFSCYISPNCSFEEFKADVDEL